MKKIIFVIIMSLFIVLFFIGFVEKRSSNDDKSVETINYGIDIIPDDLKYAGKLTKREQDIICAVSIGLVSKDKDKNIVMDLASDISKSNDGIQYEMKIRDDKYWSDGTKITPDDVVEFFKELLREEDVESISSALNIYGAKGFKEDKSTFEEGVAVKAQDDKVIIRLNKRDDNFIEELTKPQYRIRKYIVLWSNMRKNYDKLVYSGEYKIKSMDEKSMVLAKNKSLDGNNDDVDIKILKDDTVELSMAAFEVNERDIVADPPESELNKLEDEGKLITLPKNNASYLVINEAGGKTKLAERKFIYNKICKAVEEYQAQNSRELDIAEGSYFREDKKNLTKLQSRKVESSKDISWNDTKVITLLGMDSEENRILCRVIKKWFGDNEGISVTYSLVKEDEFNDEELQKRYDVVLVNNDADEKNKQQFYFNFKSFLTKEENGMLESTVGNDDKDKLYDTLESKLFNEYRILPLVFYNENIALSSEVSNLTLDGNENLDFGSLD